MTAKTKIACTFSALVLMMFARSAHALVVSGVGFVPNGPADAPSITYAQGAVTSTDRNVDRVVVADMGYTINSGRLDLFVYFVGNGATEQCTIDTREAGGLARSYTFSRPGLGAPNLLQGSVTNLAGGPFLAVSLRCVLNHTPSGNFQTYILTAEISQTKH